MTPRFLSDKKSGRLRRVSEPFLLSNKKEPVFNYLQNAFCAVLLKYIQLLFNQKTCFLLVHFRVNFIVFRILIFVISLDFFCNHLVWLFFFEKIIMRWKNVRFTFDCVVHSFNDKEHVLSLIDFIIALFIEVDKN